MLEAPPALSNWVWMFDVTPSRYPISVAVTSETATLPFPSVTIALEAVSVSVSMVVADPVMVACFASSWVWMFDVTPSR